MIEYEQWLYDSIVINKLDRVLEDPRYKALQEEQKQLQRELEDQITGAQKRLLRRLEEISIQLSSMDTELIFSEAVSLTRSLFLGGASDKRTN